MMSLNDIDTSFVKCIGYLHASDNLMLGDTVPLQIFLEDAIKSKTGASKDLTSVVSTFLKPLRVDDMKMMVYEESKQSNSDNELELDLFKEDLMCIVCNEMDVGARNRLLECSDCHSLYHQECHKPVVTIEDNFDTWVCQNCKDASRKKLQATSIVPTPTTTVSNSSTTTPPITSSSSKSSSKSSSSHRHSSSSSSYKSSSSKDKYKSSSSSSKNSGSSSKASSSSSRANAPPLNINIISADKRLQIMKKKAAKLQEKKKLPR